MPAEDVQRYAMQQRGMGSPYAALLPMQQQAQSRSLDIINQANQQAAQSRGEFNRAGAQAIDRGMQGWQQGRQIARQGRADQRAEEQFARQGQLMQHRMTMDQAANQRAMEQAARQQEVHGFNVDQLQQQQDWRNAVDPTTGITNFQRRQELPFQQFQLSEELGRGGLALQRQQLAESQSQRNLQRQIYEDQKLRQQKQEQMQGFEQQLLGSMDPSMNPTLAEEMQKSILSNMKAAGIGDAQRAGILSKVRGDFIAQQNEIDVTGQLSDDYKNYKAEYDKHNPTIDLLSKLGDSIANYERTTASLGDDQKVVDFYAGQLNALGDVGSANQFAQSGIGRAFHRLVGGPEYQGRQEILGNSFHNVADNLLFDLQQSLSKTAPRFRPKIQAQIDQVKQIKAKQGGKVKGSFVRNRVVPPRGGNQFTNLTVPSPETMQAAPSFQAQDPIFDLLGGQ